MNQMVKRLLVILVLCNVVAAVIGQSPERAEKLLRTAIDKEMVDGNLKDAVEQYKKIIATRGADRAVIARALLQLGGCYEKLGDAEARKAFEQIINQYADQSEIAAQARARLASMAPSSGPTPASTGPSVRRLLSQEGKKPCSLEQVSPDGRYFVCVGKFNLYVRELESGAQRKLTAYDELTTSRIHRPEYMGNAAWSPDGKWLSYAFGTQDTLEVCIVSLEAPKPRVVYALKDDPHSSIETLHWLPDGKTILARLFSAKEKSLLFISSEKGLIKSMPFSDPSSNSFISPDGKYLAYQGCRTPGFMTSGNCVQVYRIDDLPLISTLPVSKLNEIIGWSPDNSALIYLSEVAGSSGIWRQKMIAGMPDGSSELIKGNIGNIRSLGIDKHNRIFYQVSTALKKNMYVAAINLAQGTAIEAPKPVGQPLLAHHLSPTWSSDGKWLAYVCPQSRTEMLNPKTLCLWSVDGGQLRQVFLDKSLRLFTKMTWPVGGKYLFAQVGFVPTGLCTINPETGETVKIDVGPPPLDLFAWTPEGSVVFKNIGGFEKPDQRIIARNLKTGQETEIYHSAEACHFSAENIPVSPDGKWLAFTRSVIEGEGMPAYSTLLLVSAGGGPVREILKLTNAGERPYTTGWSPDSKFLYYSIYEQDNKMWQVSVDGGKPTETSLPLGEFSRSFTELSFHPDGKRVAFVVKSSGPSEVWVMENFLQPKASASNAAPKAP